MQVVSAFIILALLMGVVYLILRPFVIPEEFGEDEAVDPELVAQKNRVIDAIREIDMDYQTGKLSDEDYKLLRSRYTAAAAEILRRLDEQDAEDAAQIPEPVAPPTSRLATGDDGAAERVEDDGPATTDTGEDAELERRIAERRKTLQRKDLQEEPR